MSQKMYPNKEVPLLQRHYIVLVSYFRHFILLLCSIAIARECNTLHPHKERALVYIHGTLLSSAIALNPFRVYQQRPLDHSLYNYTLTKLRLAPLYYEDHILGPLGFESICMDTVNAYKRQQCTPSSYLLGIVPTIAAIESLNNTNEKLLHYTFGWSGALSLSHRQEAGFDLYFALTEWQKEYPTIPLTLLCHSHGGNVAAYLVQAEEEFHRGLQIDTLILFGTPIQAETVEYFANSMFKLVINCYSLGDRIQGKDAISVPSRKSYKALNKCLRATPSNCIIDLQMVVNNNSHALGHRELFALKKYYIPANPFIHGPHHKFFSHIDPMPICIFGPTIGNLVQQMLYRPGLHQTKLHLVSTPTLAYLQLEQPTVGISTANILPTLQEAQQLARHHWEPHAHTSDFGKALHAGKIALGRTRSNKRS
ncbi:lysophospholipase [Candidatus Dependentiae bacterium]|nr:lysophospholipase [Candidatus Dependentiae bacterium]